MAGSWRVVVEAARELDAAAYRVGDLARGLLHDDVKIKNAVVQVSLSGAASAAQTTKPFNVDESGSAKIDQVLFVQRPTKGQSVLLRVVKPHKVQKDALIGEAEVRQPSGKQRLQLLRGGKPRGYLTVSISDGIPVPPTLPGPPPSSKVSGGSSNSAAMPPAAQLPPAGNRMGHTARHEQAFASTADSIADATVGAANAAASSSSNTVANIRSSLASCFQGCMACTEGLVMKGAQAAGEAAVLQPVIAALGFQDQKGFLERKRAEPGVQRRPSGLLYRVKRKGTGKHHPLEDTPCDCHYRGRLISGKEFDSSYRDGKPARFLPQQVIKGWSEALQLMVEGDMWELFIPPELGYGDRGVDNVIPGGAVLVFEVELVKVRFR